MKAAVVDTAFSKGTVNNHEKGAEDSNHTSSRLCDLLCDTGIMTLRFDHRKDNPRNERFLLFCSDKPGCVGKVIFSTQVSNSSGNDVDGLATAKIHAIEVKETFRGNGLGGLLFHQVVTYLSTLYNTDECYELSHEQQEGTFKDTKNSSPWFSYTHKPVVLLQLDAEEDTKRHNKLRHFYESMGCTVSPNARIRYLHNNDIETYRKIPMQMSICPLVVKQCQEMEEGTWCFAPKSLEDSIFVPIQFSTISSYADNYPYTEKETLPKTTSVHVNQTLQQQRTLQNQLRNTDWIVLDEHDNGISFQTTQGLYMYATSDGKIVADGGPPPTKHNRQWIYFTLQRSYDRNITMDTNRNRTLVTGSCTENYQQLWTLQSCHGTYLCVDKDDIHHPNRYILTTSHLPVFWIVHTTTTSSTSGQQKLVLLCLRDTPLRRRYYEQWWTHQTLAYNKAIRELYMKPVPHDYDNNKNNCTKLGIKEALLEKATLIPWKRFLRGSSCKKQESLSLRSFLFHCAETARILGQPDWVQLVALLHDLGRIVSVFDNSTIKNELHTLDWTLSKSIVVVGLSPPPFAKYVDYFSRLNSDCQAYNSKLGIYTEHCGLRNVMLSWSASEYLYYRLRITKTSIPEEGLAMIRYHHLKDWHSNKKQNYYYQRLTDEVDEDMKPFVSEFERLLSHAKRTFSRDFSDEECNRLWEQFYHPICNKYDIDDKELQW